jgi:hypothetical protein
MEPPVLTTLSGGISLFWLISHWLSLGGGRRGRSTAFFLAAMPRRQKRPEYPGNALAGGAAPPTA